MTDVERDRIADGLLALLFSLRPNNEESGQAWVLTALTAGMGRAVLATVGPKADCEEMVQLVADQVRAFVTDAQSRFIQQALAMKGES